MQQQNTTQDSSVLEAGSLTTSLPWLEYLGVLLRIGRKILRGFSSEGVYEVLDYECTLELQDEEGIRATIRKREQVRYLQDYTTTFQDQAWGNAKVFLDYSCSPGIAVDEYQVGHNTFKLISLRDSRNKGDLDEFNIEWSMRNGFLKPTGFWGTSINHRTKKVAVRVVFPKGRPGRNAAVYERNLQRTRTLPPGCWQLLPDGRQMLIWRSHNPRLYEDYILKWVW